MVSLAPIAANVAQAAPPDAQAKKSPLLAALQAELERSMKTFRAQDPPAYYIGYTITDTQRVDVSGSNGALLNSNEDAQSLAGSFRPHGQLRADRHAQGRRAATARAAGQAPRSRSTMTRTLLRRADLAGNRQAVPRSRGGADQDQDGQGSEGRNGEKAARPIFRTRSPTRTSALQVSYHAWTASRGKKKSARTRGLPRIRRRLSIRL